MSEDTPRVMTAEQARFHDHIEQCGWCHSHQFQLCKTGQDLLLATVKITEEVG